MYKKYNSSVLAKQVGDVLHMSQEENLELYKELSRMPNGPVKDALDRLSLLQKDTDSLIKGFRHAMQQAAVKQFIVRKFADHLINRFREDTELDGAERYYDIETIEEAVQEFKDIDREQDDGYQKSFESYNKQVKDKVPDADETVLQFITNMACCMAVDEEQYEVIRRTFRAGYCWHFAHLLKNSFRRGEVCWAAPYGHFVWVDDNGVPYDVEGVNFGDQDYNIPESYLGDRIKDFIHNPGDEVPVTSKEDILGVIRQYEDDNNLPHKQIDW